MQRFEIREASPAEQVLGLEIARGFSTEDQDVRAAQLLSMVATEPSAVYAVLLTALEASFGAQGSYGVLGAASEASFAAVLDLCERVFCGGALAPFKARMRAQFPDAPKVSHHSAPSLPCPLAHRSHRSLPPSLPPSRPPSLPPSLAPPTTHHPVRGRVDQRPHRVPLSRLRHVRKLLHVRGLLRPRRA
jgi:hypothetical protein